MPLYVLVITLFLFLSVILGVGICAVINTGKLNLSLVLQGTRLNRLESELRAHQDYVRQLLDKPGNPIERRMVAEALADMADEDLAAGELARTIVQTPGRLNPKLRQDGTGGPAMKVMDEAYRRAKLYEEINDGGLSVVEITPITEVGTDGEADLVQWDGTEHAHLVRDPTIGTHGDRDDVR